MAEERYFHDHLNFLREGGRHLAQAFPRAASRLTSRGLDPDVERLLQGIAYLTGAVEEKHDRSLPEACQLVLDILFPHYLAPLPSASIVQLEAKQPARLPRGSVLESSPVLGTACRFQTIYEAEAGSSVIREVVWQPGARLSRLLLHMQRPATAPPLERLRLHLHGEPILTRSLFSWLNSRLAKIEVLDGAGQVLAGPGLRLQALGCGEDEALFPYPDGSFDGFRLVQEYFSMPQKFLFLDLLGWEKALAGRPLPPEFTVRFDLSGEAARSIVVGSHNFRLGCTPIVNLFEHSSDPVQRRPGQLEYPMRPAGPHGHYAIYRVVSVSGFGTRGTVEYPVLSELELESGTGAFCQLHRRVFEGQTFVYFSVTDGDRRPPEREALLCDLVCSNHMLPLGLRVGDVCQPVEVGNLVTRLLSPPTRPTSVPLGEALPARLATHLALGQRNLTELPAMRDLLTLYNFQALVDRQAARAHRLLREGLVEAQTRLVQHSYRRVPIWGHFTELTVEESAFDTEGELYLFGTIMNEVVALQAPVNTFSEFAIRGARSQETYRWPRRLGRRLLETS